MKIKVETNVYQPWRHNWVTHFTGLNYHMGNVYYKSCYSFWRCKFYLQCIVYWSTEKSVNYHWLLLMRQVGNSIDSNNSNARYLELFFVSLQSSRYRASTQYLFYHMTFPIWLPWAGTRFQTSLMLGIFHPALVFNNTIFAFSWNSLCHVPNIKQ